MSIFDKPDIDLQVIDSWIDKHLWVGDMDGTAINCFPATPDVYDFNFRITGRIDDKIGAISVVSSLRPRAMWYEGEIYLCPKLVDDAHYPFDPFGNVLQLKMKQLPPNVKISGFYNTVNIVTEAKTLDLRGLRPCTYQLRIGGKNLENIIQSDDTVHSNTRLYLHTPKLKKFDAKFSKVNSIDMYMECGMWNPSIFPNDILIEQYIQVNELPTPRGDYFSATLNNDSSGIPFSLHEHIDLIKISPIRNTTCYKYIERKQESCDVNSDDIYSYPMK